MTSKNIVNGPSKFDIMVSLFEGQIAVRKFVTFQDDREMDYKIIISCIEREDGSGESWIFKGFDVELQKHVEGYYSSKNRTGHIKIQL